MRVGAVAHGERARARERASRSRGLCSCDCRVVVARDRVIDIETNCSRSSYYGRSLAYKTAPDNNSRLARHIDRVLAAQKRKLSSRRAPSVGGANGDGGGGGGDTHRNIGGARNKADTRLHAPRQITRLTKLARAHQKRRCARREYAPSKTARRANKSCRATAGMRRACGRHRTSRSLMNGKAAARMQEQKRRA